jgi:hypothetical protein
MAKALGAGMAEANQKKIRKQEQAREKNAAAVANKADKNDLAIRARIEAQRAAKAQANQPRPRVTRRQGKSAKAAFPETQTIDEFLDLQKLTDSIRVRKSCKF